MPLSLQEILELSREHALELTLNAENWIGFLDTAARMYKYPFADQVLIHAQRPEATACASAELWGEIFGRQLKEDSESITLIDDSQLNRRGPILQHVFDVADTRGERPPYIWKMEPEHEKTVSETLRKAYREDYSDEGDLRAQIVGLAKKLTEERLADSEGTLKDPCVQDVWEQVVAASAGYLVLSRCGLNGDGLVENFAHIDRISDLVDICDLGETAGELAKEILSHVEKTIRRYEREKTPELEERSVSRGDDVSSEGKEFSAAFNNGSRAYGPGADREVRADEESLPPEPQEGALLGAPAVGEADGTPGGHGGKGVPNAGNDHEPDAGETGEKSAAGQRGGSDGLGQAHEHDESNGGIDGDPGNRLRIEAESEVSGKLESNFLDTAGIPEKPLNLKLPHAKTEDDAVRVSPPAPVRSS